VFLPLRGGPAAIRGSFAEEKSGGLAMSSRRRKTVATDYRALRASEPICSSPRASALSPSGAFLGGTARQSGESRSLKVS